MAWEGLRSHITSDKKEGHPLLGVSFYMGASRATLPAQPLTGTDDVPTKFCTDRIPSHKEGMSLTSRRSLAAAATAKCSSTMYLHSTAKPAIRPP